MARIALHPEGRAGRIADPAEWGGGPVLRQIEHRADRTAGEETRRWLGGAVRPGRITP